MVQGQKSRQIGKGMIPRGKTGVKPKKEKREMTTQSTDEGQHTPVAEPVLEPQDRNETPGNLEPENGENPLQILESKEAIVAQDENLEAALEESAGDVIDAEYPEIEESADLETAMAVGTGTVKELQSPCNGEPRGSVKPEEMTDAHAGALTRAFKGNKYTVGVDYGMGSDKGMMAVIKQGDGFQIPDELLATFGVVSIGPQPDGSEKFIITVAEGYTEAVRQWAESDGVPVERWLSDRLYEYISTYGEPAKGR